MTKSSESIINTITQQTLIQEIQQHYPLIFQQVVAWGDMDAFGHVNNVQYYRYVESARIYYLDTLHAFDLDIYPVIASSNCRYLSPVLYPDTLYIGVRTEEMRHSALRMVYKLYSQTQQKLVAEGEAVLVFLDKITHQKAKLSDLLKQRIRQFEQHCGHVVNEP